MVYCRYRCATTHWVLSSSSAATAETKGTKRWCWSSSRTMGSTASYRSLQMSPRMCAADAEMGWRSQGEREMCICVHFQKVFPSIGLYIVLPSHLGIWAAGCRVVCSRQMAAPCLLCRSASNARTPNHQTWTCCRSLWAGGDTWKTDVILLSCDVCQLREYLITTRIDIKVGQCNLHNLLLS